VLSTIVFNVLLSLLSSPVLPYVQDVSYYQCIELSGVESAILSAMGLLTNPATGLTCGAKSYLTGQYQGKVMLYRCEQYPFGCLGPADIMWRPENVCPVGEARMRVLWVWVHPSMTGDVSNELTTACSGSSVSVVVRKDEFTHLRLLGAKSLDVATTLLREARPGTGEGGNAEQREKYLNLLEKHTKKDRDDILKEIKWWKSLKEEDMGLSEKTSLVDLCSSHIPSGAVVGCVVRDPRSTTPSQRTATSHTQQEGEPMEEGDSLSEIVDSEISDDETEMDPSIVGKQYLESPTSSDKGGVECISGSDSEDGGGDDGDGEDKGVGEGDSDGGDELFGGSSGVGPHDVTDQHVRTGVGKKDAEIDDNDRASGLSGQNDDRKDDGGGYCGHDDDDDGSDIGNRWEDKESEDLGVPAEHSSKLPAATNVAWSSFCPIWDSQTRCSVSQSKVPDHVVNQTRSGKLVRCKVLEVGDVECLIPTLLVHHDHQTSLSRKAPLAGWDIISPEGWSMAFLVNSVYHCARVCGLEELQRVSFESNCLHFPSDYPDCPAACTVAQEEKAEMEQSYSKRPPAKRPNYGKLAVASPFDLPWDSLFPLDPTSPSSPSRFYVLRSHQHLRCLSALFSQPLSSLSSPTDELQSKELQQALVAVEVVPARGGCPTRYSMLCIPSVDDLQLYKESRSYAGPEEPIVPRGTCVVDGGQVHIGKSALSKQVLKQAKKKWKKDLKNSRKTDNTAESVAASCTDVTSSFQLEPVVPSRKIMGYVTTGGYQHSRGRGFGIGFCPVFLLLDLVQLSQTCGLQKPVLLMRNPKSRTYYFANIYIH
jgi:hypothetical protein